MNIEELNTALAQIFASDDLLKNEPMSKHTTFRCGGPAQFFVRASNAADITAAISAICSFPMQACLVWLSKSASAWPTFPSTDPLFMLKLEQPMKLLRKRRSKRSLQVTSLPAESQVLLVERQS